MQVENDEKWLYLKGNDPIGDTPIFDGTMIMGGSVRAYQRKPISFHKA